MSNDIKAYGRKLLNNGYTPIPIKSNKKAPAISGWTTIKVTQDKINAWNNNGLGNCGIGLRGGNLVAIDMDITDEQSIDALVAWCKDNIGTPMVRVGKTPKVALFYRTSEPFSRRDSAYYADSQHIEARSLDTQTVAFGIHPDTGQGYQWTSTHNPLNTKLSDLPTITSNHIDNLYSYLDKLAIHNHWPLQADMTASSPNSGDWMQSKYELSDDDLSSALSHVNADDYHRWIAVGMALYHQYDGDDIGLRWWDTWSSGSGKYESGDCDKKWQSFKVAGRRSTVTLGTIINMAMTAGWKNPGIQTSVPDEFPATLPDDPMAAFRSGKFINTPPPPMDWLIDGFMPANKVCLLTAPGGAGKSFFALQLSVSIATGMQLAGQWIGINPGGVLYITAEDDETDIHRRMHAIFENFADDFNYSVEDLNSMRQAINSRLFCISMVGKNARITHKNGSECEVTEAVHKIINFAKAIPDIKLIIIDPASRFRGGDENSQEDVTRFVEALEQIRSKTNAGVLVVHHANKASMRDGGATEQYAARGASALTDGVRWQANMAVLHPDESVKIGIKREEAGHFVKLAIAKTNYTAPSDGIWLNRGRDGVLTAIDVNEFKEVQSQADLDEITQRIIYIVRRHQDEENPISIAKLKRDYGGVSGEIGIPVNAVIKHVDRLIFGGDLSKDKAHKRGGGYVLIVPKKSAFK